MRWPKTKEEWQNAIDAAAGLRAIADCMMYGLITGPEIDVDRCDQILAEGRRLGVLPSRPAVELAIGIIDVVNRDGQDARTKEGPSE